jgi:hypothetical protein
MTISYGEPVKDSQIILKKQMSSLGDHPRSLR